METEHKKELLKRHKLENKKYIITIKNIEGMRIIYEVISKYHTIEEALHKIELDLMTNLHFNFTNPILIQIKEIMNEEEYNKQIERGFN